MRSGGDSRVAGVLLALATCGVLVIGPVLIGFIPIMVVGALIFFLGFDLMREALVDTWGRVHRLEYWTVSLSISYSQHALTEGRSLSLSLQWASTILWWAYSLASYWRASASYFRSRRFPPSEVFFLRTRNRAESPALPSGDIPSSIVSWKRLVIKSTL